MKYSPRFRRNKRYIKLSSLVPPQRKCFQIASMLVSCERKVIAN